MAKFEEVYEDTLSLFQKHIDQTSIPRMVKIKILSNDAIKKEFGKKFTPILINRLIYVYSLFLIIIIS